MDWADQIGPNRPEPTELDPKEINGPNGPKSAEYTQYTLIF